MRQILDLPNFQTLNQSQEMAEGIGQSYERDFSLKSLGHSSGDGFVQWFSCVGGQKGRLSRHKL
jgi:hypothetical protein